jgi:hypothetical protein
MMWDRPPTGGRLVIRLALVILAIACLPVASFAGTTRAFNHNSSAHMSIFGVGAIRINETWYVTGDVKKIGSYVARTGSVKYILKLANLCRGANAYFFASKKGGGVVAWLPTKLSGCFDVAGRSAGGPSGSPCVQAFTTPAQQDPTRAVSQYGVAGSTYRVLIAATSDFVCRDLSTQIPGGVWARTRIALTGLAAGSALLIKCQKQTARGVVDYLAPPTAIPGSKPAWWVYDQYVAGGYRFAGVPSCYGSSF